MAGLKSAKGKIDMSYIKNQIFAGETIEVEKYHSSIYLNKKIQRQPKNKITSDQQEKINEKNAIKKLRRLINANFGHGDIHIVLTYSEDFKPLDKEQAKKDLANFMKRLRRLFTKSNKELKYISVTEYKRVRIHHHLVINREDMMEILKLWPQGFINFKPLDNTGNYHQLAEYLIKETRTTFRAKDSASGKRWNGSKNLIKPVEKKEVVKSNTWRAEPHIPEGYYLDKDSLVEGVSEITSYPYQYYMLVRIKENRRC